MERDHLVFLREASEVLALAGDEDPEAFLQQIVELVRRHIRADVASLYLYSRKDNALVLRATRGLPADAVGRVRLRLGEGLVGQVMRTLEPICERAASQNPLWKPVPGLDDDPHESFMAVPLHRGGERLGVLVAQRREADYFGHRDMLAMEALASQLSTTVANSRRMRRVVAAEEPIPAMIPGRVLSRGYAQARVVRMDDLDAGRRLQQGPFTETYGIAELDQALERTQRALTKLEQLLANKIPEVAAFLFTAYQMMLMDPQYGGQIRRRVSEGENAPVAIQNVTQEWLERFAAHPDPYIQDKSVDIADIGGRLLHHLVTPKDPSRGVQGAHVAVASDLYPSDVVELYAQGVRGVVLGQGGDTSHVVLLLRSLGIPTLIVDHPAVKRLVDDTRVLLDAENGALYVDPPEPVIKRFKAHQEAAKRQVAGVKPETWTRDGVRVYLFANINLLMELSLARAHHAEGVGLYRSEFPILMRAAFPAEEEQVVIFKRLFKEMEGRPVTVRTLDLGGDKEVRHPLKEREDNPQLGLRSVRLLLHYPELFHEQLRAILRGASGAPSLRIMFPMVGGVEELQRAKTAVSAALSSLQRDGLPHHSSPDIGIMIELPSAVAMMGELAREADFFSIGTNDLVQYLLGVDRGNREVADYYQPDHPAVLRAIHRVAVTGKRYGKEVSVCGEMAHEPKFLAFFLGIGLRRFSVDPRYLPMVQDTLEQLDLESAKVLAARLLRCADVTHVRRTFKHWEQQQAKDALDLDRDSDSLQ